MNIALETKPPSLSSSVAKAARIICSDGFPTGDRAKLRRMSPGEIAPAAFYRFAFRHLPEGWERSQSEWMTVVAGIAIMAPTAHSGSAAAGTVLGESGYSEKRFERLLAAEDEVLQILLLRAARFLSAKGQTIDWAQLTQLLLSKEPEKADAFRMKIAKDYYRTVRE